MENYAKISFYLKDILKSMLKFIKNVIFNKNILYSLKAKK
jgi:hypothetical protein